MENCDLYAELISAYVDGELAPDKHAELFSHLDSCKGCRALLSMMSAVHAQGSEMAVEPPAELVSRVMSAVSAAQKTQKTPFFARFKFTIAAAIVALIVYAVSGPLDSFFPQTLDEQAADSASVAEQQTDAVPGGALLPAGNSAAQEEDPQQARTIDPPAQNAQQAEPAASQSAQAPAVQEKADAPDAGAAAQPADLKDDSAPAPADKDDIVESAPDSVSDSHDTADMADAGAGLATGGAMPENAPDAGAGAGAGGGASVDTVTSSSAVSSDSSQAAPLPEIPYAESFAFYIVVNSDTATQLFSDYTVDTFAGNYYISFDKADKDTLLSRLSDDDIAYTQQDGDASAARALLIIIP